MNNIGSSSELHGEMIIGVFLFSKHSSPLCGIWPRQLWLLLNIDATLARFLLARKGQIGTGISSKMSKIRFRFRKVKQDRHEL
ncbi:hypothetical protein HF521_009548 [Silurus meridionalis]|uniref:Uncharacterized protein n=1 Tax=Silurus meridionalis TaxID=175797 RepID=A0A8T0BYF5_SILME|nr:hypothetical protein HF521_009548 [Silurus meridionalis]